MTLKTFVSVLRPRTLAGAAAPVALALCAACADGCWRGVPALLCMAFALLMQMNANVVNDLVDGLRGRDGQGRLGPVRALSAGLVTAAELKWTIAGLTLLSAACGLPLIHYGGINMLWIGISCVVFCALYSLVLAQWGLGDVLVVVFFGLVPVMTTYYLQTGTVTQPVFLFSLGMGLATDTLLVVNNYRDIEQDRATGKHTVCVWLGKRGSLMLYLALGYVACGLSIVALGPGCSLGAYALMAAYLVMHNLSWAVLRKMPHTPAMNRALGHASRNILLYALCSGASVLLKVAF